MPDGRAPRRAAVRRTQVGHLAYAHGVELHELTPEASDLEKVFLDLTATGRCRRERALVRSELRKIRSTRLWWGLLLGRRRLHG